MSTGITTLPDGTQVETHSGRGRYKDDPNHTFVKDKGATPLGYYRLTMRESLFYGHEALRLTPENPGQVRGPNGVTRVGLLAHGYLLGPYGDSEGCVSFKNPEQVIEAFKHSGVTRLEVVASGNGELMKPQHFGQIEGRPSHARG